MRKEQLKVTNWDYSVRLSQNFMLAELINSDTAYSRNIVEQYVFKQEVQDNLKFLCDKILQPLRDELKEPIIITSGYRHQKLNTAVAGVFNSLHIYGLAVDIRYPKKFQQMMDFMTKIDFDYIELCNNYIHIQIKEMGNSRRIKDKRTYW